ncbi:MAG: methyltransferase [Brevundimonas sp.]|uniref:methyltransferase family protein n=1 Tax=Brevundimonas sp. TaxID=1871086 RepID=UPI002719A9FE|nr:methyltransferase [Brevundimonas sp.]MDO9608113.1 methyltransferase [Brevundimonas sp.]
MSSQSQDPIRDPASEVVRAALARPEAGGRMSIVAPNRWPWPPLITGGAAVVAVVLSWIWTPHSLTSGAFAVGVLLVALALGLDLWAMLEMRRRRANILPHRPATALVSTGPFAWSRNPIYLANALLLLGLGGLLDNAWFLIAAPIAALATDTLAIRREERHLALLFGADWVLYSGRVRRWCGRRRRHGAVHPLA